MKKMVSLCGFFMAIIAPTVGTASDMKINALGCKLSLPNVSDITVVGSGDVTFMFRKNDSSPPQQLIVAKYPGDQIWFAGQEETEKSHMERGKYLTFDTKTITLKSRSFAFQLLTDHRVVLYFHIVDSELSDYLDCDSLPSNEPNPKPSFE